MCVQHTAMSKRYNTLLTVYGHCHEQKVLHLAYSLWALPWAEGITLYLQFMGTAMSRRYYILLTVYGHCHEQKVLYLTYSLWALPWAKGITSYLQFMGTAMSKRYYTLQFMGTAMSKWYYILLTVYGHSHEQKVLHLAYSLWALPWAKGNTPYLQFMGTAMSKRYYTLLTVYNVEHKWIGCIKLQCEDTVHCRGTCLYL